LENTLRPRCKICEADDDMSVRIVKVREREGEGRDREQRGEEKEG